MRAPKKGNVYRRITGKYAGSLVEVASADDDVAWIVGDVWNCSQTIEEMNDTELWRFVSDEASGEERFESDGGPVDEAHAGRLRDEERNAEFGEWLKEFNKKAAS